MKLLRFKSMHVLSRLCLSFFFWAAVAIVLISSCPISRISGTTIPGMTTIYVRVICSRKKSEGWVIHCIDNLKSSRYKCFFWAVFSFSDGSLSFEQLILFSKLIFQVVTRVSLIFWLMKVATNEVCSRFLRFMKVATNEVCSRFPGIVVFSQSSTNKMFCP